MTINQPMYQQFPNLRMSTRTGEDGIPELKIFNYLNLEIVPLEFDGTNGNVDLRIVLENFNFENCDVSGFDWEGITLRNCSFTNCFTKKRKPFWQGAEFENITFRGKFLGDLVVNTSMSTRLDPQNLWPKRTLRFHENVDVALDLTDVKFKSFPTFRGIPIEKIRRGPGMFIQNYAKIESAEGPTLSHNYVAQLLKSNVMIRQTGFDIFVVPLLAKDASQYLEQCAELVELGLLSE
jgi:hypothetical protein